MFQVYYILGCDNLMHVRHCETENEARQFIHNLLSVVDCERIVLKNSYGEIVEKW